VVLRPSNQDVEGSTFPKLSVHLLTGLKGQPGDFISKCKGSMFIKIMLKMLTGESKSHLGLMNLDLNNLIRQSSRWSQILTKMGMVYMTNKCDQNELIIQPGGSYG
jgi:hypothetical protein